MVQVIIRNPRTDEEYEIAAADFRRGKHYMDAKTGDMQTFEEAGFRIVSHADGSPYEPPAPRADAGKD